MVSKRGHFRLAAELTRRCSLKAFVVASLLMVSGWAYSHVYTEIPTTARQQKLTAPLQPPANAAVLRADALIVEENMTKIPDRGAALFFLARRYAQLGEFQRSLEALRKCVALEDYTPRER